MLNKDSLLTCASLITINSGDDAGRAQGAGVFIYDDPFIWYVTAKHVLDSVQNSPVYVLVEHSKTGRCLVDIHSLHKKHKLKWVFDENYDLTATLFPSDSNFNIKAISFSSFMHTKDMIPSMICYSVGCPYGLAGFDIEKSTPCVQSGIISGINLKQRQLYVTVPTFPGNSGGPLFVWKQPIDPNGSLELNGPIVYFGGIISKYALIRDNQENHSIIPPMHLGIAVPSEIIQALLTSTKAQELKRKAVAQA